MRNTIDTWLLQWEEGGLDNTGLSALTRLLADNADARRQFREYRQMTESFRRVLGAANATTALQHRRVWPGSLPLAIAAGLILALGAWLALPRLRQTLSVSTTYASVVETTGPAWSRSPDGTWSALKPGAMIAEGYRVVTEADARIVLSLPATGTEIALAGSSVLSMPVAESAEPRLRIDQGLLFATVVPTLSGSPLEAETPHAQVRVLGTRFSLRVDGSAADGDSSFTPRSTRLEVEEGLVETRRIGGRDWIPIRSGQGALAQADDAGLFVLGATVFYDDFEKGLGQWNLRELPSGAPRKAAELLPASPETQKAVRIARAKRDGRLRSVLEINGMAVPELTVYALSNATFSGQNLVAEISFILKDIGRDNDFLNGWRSPRNPVAVRELSSPADRRVAIPRNQWVDRGATDTLRWSATPQGNTQVRITRLSDGQRKGDYVWEYDAADAVSLPYHLVVKNILVQIDHVTIRELIAVH